MVKTKKYKHGRDTFSCTFRTVGLGVEVAFNNGSDVIFLSNFVHATEANQWFRIMNREVREFSRKYPVGENFPQTWYFQFLKNHLSSCYYRYLDRIFARYTRDVRRAVEKDTIKYRQLAKRWYAGDRNPVLKAA